MHETEPMMCYAWSFLGAPLAGALVHDTAWIDIPGIEHAAATRAITALGRARAEQVTIYRCAVTIDGRGHIACTDAMQLGKVDGTAALRYFAGYLARSVMDLWQPDDLVRHYLRTGDASARAAAFHSAWMVSSQLEGPARLAARVAMYAAHADQVALATREAARVQLALRGAQGLDASQLAHYHQERVLSAALMLTIDDQQVLRAA